MMALPHYFFLEASPWMVTKSLLHHYRYAKNILDRLQNARVSEKEMGYEVKKICKGSLERSTKCKKGCNDFQTAYVMTHPSPNPFRSSQ